MLTSFPVFYLFQLGVLIKFQVQFSIHILLLWRVNSVLLLKMIAYRCVSGVLATWEIEAGK